MPICDRTLDLGTVDHSHEARMARIAQLARRATAQVRSLTATLRQRGAAFPLSEPLLRSLQGRLHRGLAVCERRLKQMERGYLDAQRLVKERWARHRRQEAFLQRFRSELTCVGSDVMPQTWTHFGWIDDDPRKPAALSRDMGHLILISGAQNAGKTVWNSVILDGTFAEGEPLSSPDKHPTCSVFFHLEEHDRLPQLLDALKENPVAADVELLARRLGVTPAPLPRLRMAVPKTLLTPELERRLIPYKDLGLEVLWLKFHLWQLGQPGIEGLLGLDEGTKAAERLLFETQKQGRGLSIASLRAFIDAALTGELNSVQKTQAHLRLNAIEEFESEEGDPTFWDMFDPGCATVLYLGGPHMGRSRVAPLVVGLMNGLLEPSDKHGAFQRLITVDEMNLLAEDEQAWKAFVRTARMVRHRGATLILMGQDLLCVPMELYNLASVVGIMAQRSPAIFEHARERVGALHGHRWSEVATLGPGEMLLGATVTSDPKWRAGGRKVRVRSLRFMHGGYTRAMI